MSHSTPEKFPFKEEICKNFCRWLEIERTPNLDEALEEATGDTYYEMRKLTSILLTAIEKWDDSPETEKLTAKEKVAVKTAMEGFKEFTRKSIDDCWADMLKKQKLGVDKLSLTLREILK